MDKSELAALFSLDAIMASGFTPVEAGVIAVMIIFAVTSLALCIFAMKAAGAAKKARNEAGALLASAEQLAADMRSMSDKVERTAQDFARSEPRRAASEEKPLRAPAPPRREALSFADPVIELGPEDEAKGRALEGARKAASEPSALLRGLIRRR